MKKYLPILLILSFIKFGIQLMGNRNYGFHRDELLHLSVSEHLAWGYFEFPPFIAWIGKLSYWFFDYSLMGTRLFPTLAGVAILVLCGLMAKEMGGKTKAVLLAGVAILAFLPFYRNHTLFQPVALDQLFWTLGFYFFIKFINTKNKICLLLMGISLGLGLMNKYTMLVWAFGLFIGLFFYQKGSLFKNKWIYISAALGLLLFLPNIIWQAQHDFPLLQHMQALNTNQLEELSPLAFLLDQVEMVPTFLLFSLWIYRTISCGKAKTLPQSRRSRLGHICNDVGVEGKNLLCFCAVSSCFCCSCGHHSPLVAKATRFDLCCGGFHLCSHGLFYS